MKRDYIDPTLMRQDDNSHTGISNEAADIFVVALVFYTLISAVFGASNLNHRGELLRDPQSVRWWHYVGLFILGWAWPMFCCLIFSDMYMERCSRRERRRTRGERRRESEGELEEEMRQSDLESGGQDTTPERREVDGEEDSPGLWRRLLSGLLRWGARRRHGQDEGVIDAQELDVTPAVSKSASESRGGENASAAAAANSAESDDLAVNEPSTPERSGIDQAEASVKRNSGRKSKGKEKQVGWADWEGKGR